MKYIKHFILVLSFTLFLSNISFAVDDIAKAPIIGYKFIYIETEASLVNFLQPEIEKVTAELQVRGVNVSKIALVFVNYRGYVEPDINKGKYIPKNNVNLDQLYLTDEGLKLKIGNLVATHNQSIITSKRRVRLGVIVDNSTSFVPDNKYNVVNFQYPDAVGFSHLPLNSYNPAVVDQEAKDKENSEKKKQEKKYTKEEIVQQRLNMIQYMQLMSNVKYDGMLELFDQNTQIYSYFALALPSNSSQSSSSNK